MLYSFTNRRRAKDAIMLIVKQYGAERMTVFTINGVAYVDVVNIPQSDLSIIMHYAEICLKPIEDMMCLEDVDELYKGDSVFKFRV